MKKFQHILILLCFLLFTGNCTLMLDEPQLPAEPVEEENGDGITSPRTETNELGVVTYQFNKGVRVIDEKYREYILTCHNDTAIHRTEILFTKNIPGDLLPKRGEYIGTNMPDLFDFTVSDQVDNVEEKNGGYLMVSRPVPLQEVFKELDFKLVANIVGDYNESDNTDSRSAGGPNSLRLQGIYTQSRAEDIGLDETNKLFSIELTSQDDDNRDYNFKLLEGGKKYDKHKAVGNNLNPFSPSVRWGIEGGRKIYSAIGIESIQRIEIDFGLTKGLDIKLDNQLRNRYCICSEEQKGYFAFPIIGTAGMTVPKDRILREQKWNTLDFLIPLPSFDVAANLAVVKLGISFGCSIAYDSAFDLKCDKPFVYEYENTMTFWSWSLKTSKDYNTKIERMKKQDMKDINGAENIGYGYFKDGSRFYGHFEIGLFMSAGDPTGLFMENRFTPLKINIDAAYTHIIANDYNSSKPSTLHGAGNSVYYATDKSMDDERVTLTESMTTEHGIGGIPSELAKYWDWFSLAMNTAPFELGAQTLWHKTDGAFPYMEHKLIYEGERSNAQKAVYSINLKVGHPNGKIYESKWADQYADLELMIFDEEYNYIKSAIPTDPKHPEYRELLRYPYLSLNREYPFEFTLSPDEMLYSRYFYVVPAYKYGYIQRTAGMTDKFIPTQNLFTQPSKYNIRGNWGTITSIQPLWVENDDKYCKPGYSLDGIAVDAECAFMRSDVGYVYINVEFYDSDGKRLTTKDFEYSTGKNHSGIIKAIYLINHRIETVVSKAKVTLYYMDPDKVSSVYPDKKVILSEQELIFDDDTESWPVYDYTNPADWTAKGYRLAY